MYQAKEFERRMSPGRTGRSSPGLLGGTPFDDLVGVAVARVCGEAVGQELVHEDEADMISRLMVGEP